MQNDLASMQPWAFAAILLCLIVLPATLSFRQNNAGAITVAATCGLAAVLVFIPQVQSLELGPLKAEMRAKIEEANATLAQLRSLTSDLARVSVLAVVEQGVLGGPNYKTLYAIRQDLERQLLALHTNPSEIDNIFGSLNARIQEAFGIQIEGTALAGRENTPIWQPLYDCIAVVRNEASVEKFQACLKVASISSPELDRLLEELAEFQRTGRVARLDADAQGLK